MNAFPDDLANNLGSPLARLLLQILVILVVARVCGLLVRRVGQPQVIGEILAGILLGPSLFQLVAPGAHAFVFPQGSAQQLYFLSQVGILLFMFIVGLELDTTDLRSRITSLLVVSGASVAIPFAMGFALALLLFSAYGPPDKGAFGFALFMGIAMSITAFPVLVRIIQEHRLMQTPLATMAITCAAVNDVAGWCLLAIVVGLTKSGSGAGAVWTIGFTGVYAVVMLFAVRPFLNARFHAIAKGAQQSSGLLAFAFIALLVSAWVTEMIGIHALFGAFLMGIAMPQNAEFRRRLTAGVHDVTTVILLPLFFAFTGLRTQIGLLDDAASWLACALVLLVAILGKFGGTTLAARFTGHGWRNAFALGALMNTRGLIELIVLNLGYDLGILGPKIFTMMVVMAVLTTMMAGPILNLLKPLGSR